MCKVQMLRALVKQRLTAAAEEICGLFERTIAEYEEELSRSKEENERQQKLLDAVLHPQLQLHRADVQQLLVVKEVPPEQQEWSPSLDQEDPEPPHIKEEQEELWTSQEGEQLQGLEDSDIEFPFSPVSVKSEEDDEEKPQSSQLHQSQTEQMETEADGEDSGGPEPARNSDSDAHLQPDTVDKTGDCSVPEAENSDDWKETREPQSRLNSLKNDEVTFSDFRCSAGEKPFSCCEFEKTFGNSGNLRIQERTHTGEKPFSCSVCKKSFTQLGSLQKHMRVSVCVNCFPADVQQLLVVKEEVLPEQQEWSSSLDQEDPQPTHIKEEQEELWTSQEGEQLQGLEEADIKFPFSPVPVKSEEDDEEEPQSSQFYERQIEQMETEADGDDCGGPKPARNSDPDAHLQPDTYDKTGDFSEPETENSDDWKETREPQSGLNSLKNYEVPLSDSRCSTREKPFSCSECGKTFGSSGNLKRHIRTHTGEKPFSCSVCKKSFTQLGGLQKHTKSHTGEKPFSCSVCGKGFIENGHLNRHMRSHTGEKPFSCSLCGKDFIDSGDLKVHMRTHTGEKPFSCSVCKKSFTHSGSFRKHVRNHTGEKPFNCSVCGKCFIDNGHLNRHMRRHTGEKPFGCSVCGKDFTESIDLKVHMRTHTGEKPFNCSVCNKSFAQSGRLHKHMVTHTGEKPFSCSVCKNSFAQKGYLQTHMRIHTGEKPFSCPFCDKRFLRKDHMKLHMRTHTGETPL
ncbi:oocyte zinc finger protein XlCOF22-like isoform X1 [Sebastes umbrosus]|uniref:oocyte zinc finger protein XlCOF22-like isoform X1 n=1 Tax=Sebastes umbrosus TaxID=72105 RepID=UPI0018A119FC|nr:oocyte zinc finger protein XlCOF22-like isoform X1 [Sebastes umbrosus]